MQLKHFIIENYLPYHKSKTLNAKNYQNDVYNTSIVLKYDIVDKAITEIKTSDIEIFFKSLESDRCITKSTINRYRARLSSIFKYAIEQEIINFNPVSKTKQYKEIPRSMYLQKNDVKMLLKASKTSKNKELYFILILALNTGMRLGEILALEHTEFQDDVILLPGAKTKSGLSREVPLNKTVKEIYLSFPKITNKLFKTKCIRSAFRVVKKRANVPKYFRFHDLRRTFATHMINAGVNIYTLSQILGHADIKTTERYLMIDRNKLLDSTKVLVFK